MHQSFLIASGKGGVGKSTLTANLAFTLSRMGRKVCIVDADIGLRDQDVLLGLENNVVYDLVDVVNHDCTLDQALVSPMNEPDLKLLPAAQFKRVKAADHKRLSTILRELKYRFDYVLIDCPAGIENGFRNVLKAGVDQAIIVCTPDDVCIRNAERVISLLNEKNSNRPTLIVNRLDSELIQKGEMYSAETVAGILDIPLLGEIPEDRIVYRSQLNHMFFADVDCEARSAVRRIAGRIKGEHISFPDYGKKRASLFHRIFGTKVKEVRAIDR